MDNQTVYLKRNNNDKFLNRIGVKSSIMDRINWVNVRKKKKSYKINSPKEESVSEKCVQLNSVISVKTSFGLKHYLQIVLPEDADIKSNKLSVFSSLGSGVYGKKVGDIVEWNFLGQIEYAEILKISMHNYRSSIFLTTK